MSAFQFSRDRIETASLQAPLSDPVCGGYASFEGWVRNHNEGLPVTHLEYEAFEALAVKEGERIIAEAIERFGIAHAACVHRIGDLAIGEMAVWVGASSRHRHEAFLACRYIIDEVKHRVPIWKKEHYENGDSGWVNCERCSLAREHTGDHTAVGPHSHGVSSHQHVHGAQGMASSAARLVPDYSRQMALREVGPQGQAKLRASRVLVIGAGGLGVPVLTYLAGAGIGRIGIVDSDKLEPSNLHRQTLYALADAGQHKAELAAARLRALNPDVEVVTHVTRLDATNGVDLLSPYELVIDCTDNFSTKFLLNDLCMQLGKPAILSSVYQYEGQLQVIRPDLASACLRCVWPDATRDGLVGNCSEAGVLGPVPGIFGSLQALEALKVLLDLPGRLTNELLVFDLTSLSITRLKAKRSPDCQDKHCNRIADRSAQLPDAGLPAAGLEVTFETLEEAVDQGYALIDIREANEVREAPAPTSKVKHIPLGDLLHGAVPLDPTRRHLLVCASGRRSLAATQELRSRGFTSVWSLRGGVQGIAKRSPA